MTQKRKLSVQASDNPKRISLRLAANTIKSTQEPEQTVYEKLTLTLADDGHAVYVELIKDPETSEEWEFEPTREGYMVRNLQDQSENQVEGKSFIRAAVEQCAKILKTPNLHLKKLFIDLEPPGSICRKLEAAHKMFHPEDKEFKCTPPECIKKLHEDNSQNLLRLLGYELRIFNFKLPVECFKIEFDGGLWRFLTILSAFQPTTLKKIVIDSGSLDSEDDELVSLDQWKQAEQLECFDETSVNVEQWKHFKTVDIALKKTTKEELDKILETFLFLSTWEQVSMQFRDCKVRRDEYFKEFQVQDTTVIPGIVDNWVIEVPVMNHKVFVIFSEGTLHLIRKHWVVNRRKKVAVRRMYRKSEAVLVELPDVLARKVVEQLDEISKRSLRQTCRVFNNIVRTTGSTYEKLTLTLADNRPAIFIELFIDAENRLELEFEQYPLGYTVKNPQEGWEQTVVYNRHRHGLKPQFDFIGAAVQHFFKVFTKKTVVKKLCLVLVGPWDIYNFLNRNRSILESLPARLEITAPYSESFDPKHEELTKTFLNLLSRKQHLLKVEHIEVHQCYSRVAIARVIKFLDPMILEKISLNGEFAREEYEEIASFETWKRAKEFYCSEVHLLFLSPTIWSHFPKSEIDIHLLTTERFEGIFNELLVSTTWNNVLLTSITRHDTEQFLNRREDQRPIGSRIVDSKLIRIPNIPNQFINCQLTNDNISFTRVIQ